jgi:RecA/RadA recombinase
MEDKLAQKLGSIAASISSQITKDYGDSALYVPGANEVANLISGKVTGWVPTGLPGLDAVLGREQSGFPLGRLIEIFGAECLDSDTHINYEVRTRDGRRQNSKGGTIERLYCRFNKRPIPGQGNYVRPVSEESEYFASSINEEGRVIQNRIENVVDAGEKTCFVVSTESGRELVASGEHRLFSGTEFVELQKLSPGDSIYIHNNTPYRSGWRELGRPQGVKEITVKHHPYGAKKLIVDRGKEYIYYRIRRPRAITEAEMNQLPLDVYIARLNAGDLDGLVFLPSHMHVHHKDENNQNDDSLNREILPADLHGVLHARARHNNLRFMAIPDKILTIEPCLEKRHCYDICMAAPYNNYIANGIIVHNSHGKSSLLYYLLGRVQASGGFAFLIDTEDSYDSSWGARLGIDNSAFTLLPVEDDSCLEKFFEMIMDITNIIRKKDPKQKIPIVFGWDTIVCTLTKEELERTSYMDTGRLNPLSRAMSNHLKSFCNFCSRMQVGLIFVNQIRDNVGVSYGEKFTTPGGHSIKHHAFVRAAVKRVERVKKDQGAIISEVRNIKNKLGAASCAAQILLSPTNGICGVE